jgi:hypothetical protein
VTPLRSVPVYLDVTEQHRARVIWVLDTLLGRGGAGGAIERDPPRAADCALVYANHPMPGPPTLPASTRATELFAHDTPLPADEFATFDTPIGPLPGAFAMPSEGFVVPFDPLASAFVLLACWDEHTATARDMYDRLPWTAGVFAANPALAIGVPAVDGYLKLVRRLVNTQLEALGAPPLEEPSWGGGVRAKRFAVALTHDIDNLWRWTPRGVATALRRALRALRYRRWRLLRRELRDLRLWLTHHLPRRTDPFWTFPAMLAGEDERGVSSTFFVIAGHAHPLDGAQPRTYAKRIPAALALLRAGGRELGLHGNDRDRGALGALTADRDDLASRGGAPIDGMRYHYLRCRYHETLPLLDQAGFAYDSSIAFAGHEGLRCGFSYPFHPYDLKRERPLDLIELPLALMDTTLAEPHHRDLDAAGARAASLEVLEHLRAARGAGALLWHNVRFDAAGADGYDQLYWELVEWIGAHGGVALPAGELVRRWRQRCGEADSAAENGASPAPEPGA